MSDPEPKETVQKTADGPLSSAASSADEPPTKRPRLDGVPAVSEAGVQKDERRKVKGMAFVKEE